MGDVVQMPERSVFDEFWAVYPRHIGKIAARAKWDAITGRGLKTSIVDPDTGEKLHIELQATPEEILAGAKKFRDSISKDYKVEMDQQFIPHPRTWLNQGRWLDND
tara:strand:- start:832 stop:1149 length:318 start_codon:yes stop_codon:yes gene_type:complete